jgi:hypothetical protein
MILFGIAALLAERQPRYQRSVHARLQRTTANCTLRARSSCETFCHRSARRRHMRAGSRERQEEQPFSQCIGEV